jgi:hypothetical protein
MTEERVARRYPAAEFPEIQGVYLLPIGAAATLINLSATGVLVGCATRSLPGTVLTVQFKGTFTPAAVECRVVRCEVAGIAADGSLQFQLGLAFGTRIELARDSGTEAEAPDKAGKPEAFGASVPLAVVAAAAAAPRGPEPVLRNRW